MNLKQLLYFSTISKAGSFSNASKKLYITQPALSKAIHNLEDEIGFELFRQKGRTMVLTEKGQQMLAITNDFLSSFDDYRNHVVSLSRQNSGKLRVGIPNSVSRYIVSNALAAFCTLYPDIQLSIVNKGAQTIQEQVISRELDCGIAMAPIDTSLLNAISIINDDLIAVVPCDSPFNRPSGVSLEDLRTVPLITLGPEHRVYHEIVQSCAQLGFEPIVRMTLSDIDLIFNLVSKGMGISIQSRIISETTKHSKIALVPFDEGRHHWNLYMIAPKQNNSDACRTFLNHFKNRKEIHQINSLSDQFPYDYRLLGKQAARVG